MTREYAAFISYRHKPLDMAVAMRIHKSIERFIIPRDLRKEEQKNPGSVFAGWDGMLPQRMVVFRDREELPLSNDLTSDIFDALDHAKNLIVICTPDTPKSMWVRREISHFIEKHGRKRIITVLAAGTPEESIPKEITTRYADDGVTVLEEYEPLVAYLAADSQREVMKKLDQELLRIYAALLGCPYDSLKQRHKRRKMQQALAVAAAAFLVALSFIGVLVNRNLEIQAQKLQVEEQKLQVEEQKREAEEQRRMVQLRESELLAADARAALDAGNTRLAIENAVSALPKAGEEDRPYYAPAESVLMEAMDIMGGAEENVLLSDTVLEQMTPISNLDISGDGSVVVTVDEYGVLHGYDAVSGREAWTDIIAAEETTLATSHVRISEDDQYLVCLYGETLEGRSLQDGKILWRYDMDLAADGYFIYDDQQNQIAVLQDYYSAEEKKNVLELGILSASTGEMRKTIMLEQLEDTPQQTIHDSHQTRLPAGGTFSENGRYFACAFYRQHENEEKSRLMCFVADLQEGKLVSKMEKELPFGGFYVARMAMEGNDLLVVLEPKYLDVAGSVLKLDWKSGQVLWHTTTPEELDRFLVSGGMETYTLLADTVLILGKHDRLYAIDMQTGQIQNSTQFPGTLSAMYPAGDTYFGFALRDGTYAIGVYSSTRGFTLTTESAFDITASVGEHSLMQIQGGGIVQVYSDGQSIEISVSNVDRPGYLVAVPKENENRLIIKRPVTLEKAIHPSFVETEVNVEDVNCSDSQCVPIDTDRMILGQFYYYGEDYTSNYVYMDMDVVTHEVKQVHEMEGGYRDQYFFLRDGSGYLHQNSDDVTTLVQNGKQTQLAEHFDSSYPEDEQYVVSGLLQTHSVYLTDGTVLTVLSDSKKITFWKDGAEAGSAELPDSHKYADGWNPGLQRYVQAGRNGFVVTHFTRLMENAATTDVAFCDTANGTWILPKLEAPLSNTATYAFAETAPLFAAVDTENTVRVLNLKTGGEVAAFPLQLPCNSVLHMDFLLDDGYLMVKTRDAKVLVYEIASGRILLQDQLSTSYRGTLTAREDPVSQRLYIVDTYVYGENALCIDMRSWTVLARVKDVLCYVPKTNELYCADNVYGVSGPQLFYFQVPDTNELVQLGQKILEAG